MRNYDTVIFDLDGTLLNTLADLTGGVNYVLLNYGYPPRRMSEIRRFLGNGIRKLMERALPEHVEDGLFEEILTGFREYYTAHCRLKTKPYDGIMEMLQTLKDRGVHLAIVSNKNDAAVKELSSFFFGDLIEVTVGQKENIPTKPAPDMVEHALSLLGSGKKRAVYVGDSGVDKSTADHAGMDCFLVTWGFCDRKVLMALEPNQIVDDPGQLLDFLDT